jgi:hypothetical protein
MWHHQYTLRPSPGTYLCYLGSPFTGKGILAEIKIRKMKITLITLLITVLALSSCKEKTTEKGADPNQP